MGRVSRTAVIVWSLVSLAGCASIAGLDSIQECAGSNCPFDSGGGGLHDSSTGLDTGADDTGPGLDSSQPDSGVDSAMTGDSSVGQDSQPTDTGIPSETSLSDVHFTDAPFDATGCGNLNTTTNCGGCGLTCTPTSANQASCCTGSICPGSTDGTGDSCQYTCQNGHIDCNAATPPNSDGCECAAPTGTTCCGTSCPTQHTTGLVGQSYYPANPNFYDCVPTSTMNSQLAQDACVAYVTARGGAAGECNPFLDAVDATSPDSWCAAMSPTTGFMGDCICWSFAGQYAGQVFDPQALGVSPASSCWNGTSPTTFN